MKAERDPCAVDPLSERWVNYEDAKRIAVDLPPVWSKDVSGVMHQHRVIYANMSSGEQRFE